MPKSLVEEIRRDDAAEQMRDEQLCRRHGVQIPGGITAEDHRLGSQILYRETKQVKLNRNRIVMTNLTNRKQVRDEKR